MKYIKTFEDNSKKINSGDYFIVNKFRENEYSDSYVEFLRTHIGRIDSWGTSINSGIENDWIYSHFIFNDDDDEKTRNLFSMTQGFRLTDIILSKNKEYLELILKSNKFNI